jgi:hypothetical protein
MLEVEVFCFAASYTVTLILEVTRLFYRASLRMIAAMGFAAAGLVAHTLYLVSVARDAVGSAREMPLSSWHHWCLLAAWVLVASYLAMALARPRNALGLFFLPPVLLLIAVAWWFPSLQEPFPRDQAYNYWSIVHGVSLLLGTVVVMLGFVAGVMYLVQSYRLKHKLAPRQGLRLPSLEWLQRMNEDSFVLSSVLLAAGLVSGVVLNLIRHAKETGALPWNDPVVWTSAVLFLWLAAASVFNFVYKPARQGRKVAYLTVASFLFLGFALGVVLFGTTEHASSRTTAEVIGAESRIVAGSLRAPSQKTASGVCLLLSHASGLPPGGAA